MKFCECGCGQEVKRGRRFIRGHHTRGVILSDETKKKLSKAALGNRYSLGHKHSDETKQKMKGRTLSDKTKRKISESNSGENHPNWRGGSSFAPYCAKFNNKFKEQIREKFGRACFLCGEKEKGRKLSVHHVNYDKSCLCSDIKCEFVPLCMSCHNKTTNGDREYYENLILEKLEA